MKKGDRVIYKGDKGTIDSFYNNSNGERCAFVQFDKDKSAVSQGVAVRKLKLLEGEEE